ncbi:MAG TPA: hypothetical protein VG273_28965 [Bryobacteraceae bacterium]|jgi:hypothetical protein|nr:hypothetical protein [Bryobacteraceae bacterium]
MRNSLLRPFLVLEFLVAIDAVFTLWSEVGGQYHLDLMFWPWKLAIGTGASLLVVMITAELARHGGEFTKQARLYSSVLIAVALLAALVTFYYHVNEPADPDDDSGGDAPAQMTHTGYSNICSGVISTAISLIPNRSSRSRDTSCRP